MKTAHYYQFTFCICAFHLRSWPSDPEPVMSKNSPGVSWVMVTSAKTLPVGVNMWLILVMPTWKQTGHRRSWEKNKQSHFKALDCFYEKEDEMKGVCWECDHLNFNGWTNTVFQWQTLNCTWCRTFGMVLANRRSSSLCESFPFTTNFPKGVRSITPTFSITSLHSLPAGPNQLVRRKLGLNTTQRRLCFNVFLIIMSGFTI